MDKPTLTELECKRCGHIWYPRRPQYPKVCPRCKSPWWDTPRGNNSMQNLPDITPAVTEFIVQQGQNNSDNTSPMTHPANPEKKLSQNTPLGQVCIPDTKHRRKT